MSEWATASTTCGLCVVVVAATVLLAVSLEASLWDAQQVRTAACVSSSARAMSPCASMDVAVSGQCMLHTAVASSTRSAMLVA